MNINMLLIDHLDEKGTLTTYRIRPKDTSDSVVIDRLRDIDPSFKASDTINVGGVRIYNFSSCSVQILKSRLRHFGIINKEISFTLEHMDIPVGRPDYGTGYYNLVLSPKYRFTQLHIVDPYDESQRDLVRKKHFRYEVLWDTKYEVSLANMELRSNRGTFSFILTGQAKVFQPDSPSDFVTANEISYAVSNLLNGFSFEEGSKYTFIKRILSGSEWLELKPNIMGIGFNLNNLIKDFVQWINRKS